MKKLLAMLLTVFTVAMAGVFYGCGDPYKNAKVSILSETSLSLNIDSDKNADRAQVKVKISNMPKNSTNEIIAYEIDKDVASVDNSTINYNASTGITTFDVVAGKGGSAVLIVRAEGGKSAAVEIFVTEALRGISFVSTYKPAIIKGKDFVVDSYSINFEPATASNKRIRNYELWQRTNRGLERVRNAVFTGNVLLKRYTENLDPQGEYYIRAESEDGPLGGQYEGYKAETRIAVVDEIFESDIEIRTDDENKEIKDSINLAINVADSFTKNFYISVKDGAKNLQYDVIESQDNIYTVHKDNNDSTRFSISALYDGVSYVTIKVGYRASFDYYYVTRNIPVEVSIEPLQLSVNGHTSLNTQENFEYSVFSDSKDAFVNWQKLDVQIEPKTTTYKNIEIRLLENQVGRFTFATTTDNINFKTLNFDKVDGVYRIATFSVNENLYVAKNNISTIENNFVDVVFRSERSKEIKVEAKLYAREQIEDLNILQSGSVNFIALDEKENQMGGVLTAFAPLGDNNKNIVEFTFDKGYADLTFIYEGAKLELNDLIQTQITSNNKKGFGSFSLHAIREGYSTLYIYNGVKLLKTIRVIGANAAGDRSSLRITTNDSKAIIKTESTNNLLNKIYFNNNVMADAVKM